MRRALALGIALALLAPAAALAYRLDHHVVPAPKILYYVALKDWRAAFDRAVHQVNAAHVGVRLVRARIPEQAPIQVGRLNHTCGRPGVEATTASIPGGYSAIYLPRGCRPVPATIIVAHELGHALGLKHEDRRCALMNASGTGANDIPSHCLGRRIDWLHHPFRADDIAGLRRLYRNTPPTAHLRLSRPVGTDRTAHVALSATDRERNISQVRIDWGDGRRDDGYRPRELPRSHSYSRAGTYTIRFVVTDLYLRRAVAQIKVRVP